MANEIEAVVERLADAGVRLDRGLTEADLRRIEKKYGFTFGPDHAALLRAALPLGDTWLNWRHATPAKIRERFQPPNDLVVRAVLQHDFWPAGWGERPRQPGAAERSARAQLALVPTLVPLYADRYVPAAPAPPGSPVFQLRESARGLEVTSVDLAGFVAQEFENNPGNAAGSSLPSVAFWSELATSDDSR